MLVIGKPLILNKELFLKRVEDILDSGIFSNNGPYTEYLESFLKEYLGVKYVVAVNNATSALDICLAFLKTKHPFGQIVVPSFTFVASVHSIVRAGFEPVFADIDDNFCLDMESVDARVNPSTVAIMPVNLFGNYNNPANFARYRDLFIINDSAQAFGVFLEEEDQYAGTFGNCEIMSFHPTKLAGGFEGGIITTNNSEIAEFAIQYRNFGFTPNAGPQGEIGPIIGTNYKINEIQSCAILTQIENLEEIQSHYYDCFAAYRRLLPDWIKLIQPNVYFSNFSYIVAKVHPKLRDGLVNYLYSAGIFARTYFSPIHRSKPYAERFGHLELPNTDKLASECFCLPTGLHITPEDCVKIVDKIKEFLN